MIITVAKVDGKVKIKVEYYVEKVEMNDYNSFYSHWVYTHSLVLSGFSQ